MAALTTSRVIDRRGAASTATPPTVNVLAKAAAKGFKGGLVAVDATGFGISGASLQATGLKIIGIAEADWDNTAGANGAITIVCRRGVFPFANLGGDLVVQGDFMAQVFADDDQTVRHSSNTNTRSAAGVFMGFDENGLPLVQVGNFSQTGV